MSIFLFEVLFSLLSGTKPRPCGVVWIYNGNKTSDLGEKKKSYTSCVVLVILERGYVFMQFLHSLVLIINSTESVVGQ